MKSHVNREKAKWDGGAGHIIFSLSDQTVAQFSFAIYIKLL
jgi:hypothetical protein